MASVGAPKRRRVTAAKQEDLIAKSHELSLHNERAMKLQRANDGLKKYPVVLDAVLSLLAAHEEREHGARFPRGVTSLAGDHNGVPKKVQIQCLRLVLSPQAFIEVSKMSSEEVKFVFLVSIGASAKDSIPEKRMVIDQFYRWFQECYRKAGSILKAWTGQLDWNFQLGYFALVCDSGRITRVLHRPSGVFKDLPFSLGASDIPGRWSIKMNYSETEAIITDDAELQVIKLRGLFKDCKMGSWGYKAVGTQSWFVLEDGEAVNLVGTMEPAGELAPIAGIPIVQPLLEEEASDPSTVEPHGDVVPIAGSCSASSSGSNAVTALMVEPSAVASLGLERPSGPTADTAVPPEAPEGDGAPSIAAVPPPPM